MGAVAVVVLGVNKAIPALFARYPDAETLAAAEPEDVEPYINTSWLFRNKSEPGGHGPDAGARPPRRGARRHARPGAVTLAAQTPDDHRGEVPGAMRDLVRLPGVGPKTANVIRSSDPGVIPTGSPWR